MTGVAIVGFGSLAGAIASLVAARRNHWFVVAFAATCAVGATCAFLADLWVLGIAGILAYLVAMRRWIDMQEGYGQAMPHPDPGHSLRPRRVDDRTFVSDTTQGDRR